MKGLEKKRDSEEGDNDKDCPRLKRDARNKGHTFLARKVGK